MTGAGLILALVGLSFQSQDADEMANLRKSVEALTSENDWFRAHGVLQDFALAHPSLREDARYKMLLQQTQDLAHEAEGLFKKQVAEAEKDLRDGQFAKAIIGAAGALRIYPEHQALVTEVQGRARGGLAGKDLIRIPSKPCSVGSNDHSDEQPLREVKVGEFLVDKYPVTN